MSAFPRFKALACCLTLILSCSRALSATEVEGIKVLGLDFYERLSGSLAQMIATHYKKKIVSEALNFKWTPLHEGVPKSAPAMYMDASKRVTISDHKVEFWGLEETMTGFSVAYKYEFDCAQIKNSHLQYAVQFSLPKGEGVITSIDTHFNGRWYRGGDEGVDQSLSNFEPFGIAACQGQ
jgi:hypothetical protein